MTRLWQRISTCVGLTAYLLAVTCGDLLHTHHHGGELAPCGVELACDHDAAEHDHEHHDDGAPASPHDDDCSICRFQAQQPLAAKVVIIQPCLGAVLEVLCDDPSQPVVTSFFTHHSRAPPAVV